MISKTTMNTTSITCTKLLEKNRIIHKCYKLTEFSYQTIQTNTKHINETNNLRFQTNIIEKRQEKQNYNFDIYKTLSLKGSNEFQPIRQEIFRCKNSKLILKLLKLKENEYAIKYDQSIYNSAITKCGELGDIKSAYKIMKYMGKNNIKRDRNTYNILFRALSINECVYNYSKYIKKMISKDNIKPDIITATILIGGCKKRGDIETAENIWNNIILKFELQATEITYIEILNVYAKAANSNKAQIKFKEMIENGIKPNESSCSALMKCFVNCFDIQNVLKIKTFMELKGLKIDWYIYLSLINVYKKTKLPKEA
eukprot:240231_1